MRNGEISTLIKLVFKIFFICVLFLLPDTVSAQYDYEHYVPPFYNGSDHPRDIGKHMAVLSTNVSKDVVIYIYRGDSDEIMDQVTISRNSPKEYLLRTLGGTNQNTKPTGADKGSISLYPSGYDFPLGVVGAHELNKPLSDQGLRFFSSDAPFFVNIRHVTYSQGGSLTTKGTYAYGTNFRSGHVYTDAYHAANRRSHFISVMATEDTEVTFSEIKIPYLSKYNETNGLYLEPHNNAPIVKILRKGQSYVLGIDHNAPVMGTGYSSFNDLGKSGWNDLNGTSITSTKPIVVNTGSWLTGPNDGQDMGFDQIVPIKELGDRYIVMRAKGRDNTTERPIVVATENDTEVFVNGTSVNSGTLLAEGDYLILDQFFNDLDVVLNDDLLIDTKGKNVYVYQTMSGDFDKHGPTVGLNFIPPLTDEGIKVVSIPKADVLAGKVVEDAVITILTREGATVDVEQITYNANGTVKNTSYYNLDEEIGNSNINITKKAAQDPTWSIYKVKNIVEGDFRFTSSRAINVAWVVRSRVIGAAGYYSGFTKAISKIVPEIGVTPDGDLDLVCESYDDQKISIAVSTPILPDHCEWYENEISGNPIGIGNSLIIDAPEEETIYHAVGYYHDPTKDSEFLGNGDFSEGGYNMFETSYQYTNGGLMDVGHFAITSNPSKEHVVFNPVVAKDEGFMFLGYSKTPGELVYERTETNIRSDLNYIFKMHGILAKDDSPHQSLKITINGDEILENDFIIRETENWQSITGFWDPKGATDAIIRITNTNPSENSVFAIDSLSLATAIVKKAEFVARVVPNYSYDNHGGEVHFCLGEEALIDVSYSDNPESTAWYEYSWYKMDGDTELALSDGSEYSGTQTHILRFLDLNIENYDRAVYKCKMNYAVAYEQCGLDIDNVEFTITIGVDENINLSIQADRTIICEEESITLQGLAEGRVTAYNWFVQREGEEEESVATGREFNFHTGASTSYSGGQYTIRCEAVNGCEPASDEIIINVLSAPVLNSLTTNENLCEGQPIILTADAVGDGVLTYTWMRDAIVLAESGNILNYPASISDRDATFKVKVASVYTIGDETKECPNSIELPIQGLDIFPLVTFDETLVGDRICEGSNYSFNVTMNYPGPFYTYLWDKDDVDLNNSLSSYNLSAVDPAVDAGKYKVVVTNRCNSALSEADLLVTPEIVVNGFSLNNTGPFCAATNVTATFDVVNNGATYVYQVEKPDGTIETITNPYTFPINDTNEGEWEFRVSSDCDEPIPFLYNLYMHDDFGALTVDDIGACVGQTVTFEASVLDIPTASGLTYVWTDNLGNPIGTNSDQLEIVNVQDANLGTYTVLVTDQCGNNKTESGELTKEAITSPATAGATPVCEGDNFTSTISYVGSPTFEWLFGDPVTGINKGNTETLTVTGATPADAGTYYCNVHLTCGTDLVIQRELIVNSHISLADPLPETLDVCNNEEIRLNVDVVGTDYAIEWKDASNDLIGNGSSIQLNMTVPMTYTYTANVIGLCDTIVKNYTINVHEQPTITAADNSLTECSGLVNLNVTATGEHNGIVWEKDGNPIVNTNTDPANFVIATATNSDNGIYTAEVSNTYCDPAHVSINLKVINSIVVTDQSAAIQTRCEDEEATFFVTAEGHNVTYKWTKTSAPDAILSTLPSFTIGDVLLDHTGDYQCELSNDSGCGNLIRPFTLVVNKNPSVTNPISHEICETETSVDFTVTGDAQGTVNFQWFNNDGEITGATAATYTENTLVNGQAYYCEVTGDASVCGLARSEKATLTIVQEVAVTNPSSVTIADGADVSFSVVASGEPSYTYQWQILDGTNWIDLTDGGNYSDVDQATLHITRADKATFDGNQYRCVIDSDGAVCTSSATSDPATLTVTDVTKIAVQAKSTTVCFDTDATISVEGASADLTYTWYYKKGSDAYETVVGKDGMSVSLSGNVSTLTIPADDLDINNWAFQCVVSDMLSTDQTSNEVVVTVLENIAVTTDDATFTPCENDAFSLSVVATGDAIKYKWYKVGAEATILSTSASYNLGNVAIADAGSYKCETYNDLGCNDLERTFVVDVKNHATITNPTDVTMCASDVNPTFTANGTAEGTLTYEWFDKDDNLVVGATTNTLTVASPVNGQSYYAVASGDFCDDAKSDRATLTILDEVSVTDPVDVEVADGGTGVFSIVASGTPNYIYQWQVLNGTWTNLSNDAIYSGIDTPTLEVIADLTLNGKQYRCIVSSSVCSDDATSNLATLSVNTVIKIAKQPSDDEVCEGSDAIFVLEGAGVNPLTFTWKYHTGDLVWKAIEPTMLVSLSGKTSTLTVQSTTLTMNGWEFKCIVSDGSSADNESNFVSVNVLETLSVTTPLNNAIAECEGEPLLLSVSASGSDPIYKWYETSAPATVLSTNDSYDFGTLQVSETGIYKCEISNSCGLETVTYDVVIQEHATVTNPADQIVCSSETNIDFRVTGTASGTITYEWFDKDHNLVDDATTNTLTIANPDHGQSYYCVVSGDACENATSAIATLTVYEEVTIVDDPIDAIIPDGGNATFTVNVAGEPDYTYQWQKWNGATWDDLSDADAHYTGSQSKTLQVLNADQLTFNGSQYRCVAGNTECSAEATSNLVTLTITSVVKIAAQPENENVCLPALALFEITGSTTGLVYEWQYSADGTTYNTVTPIVVPEIAVTTDANGSRLEIATTTSAMNGWTFRCIVKDEMSANDTSNVVSLHVVEPVNFDPLVDENLCFGIEKQISLANVTGTGPIRFSWSDGASEVSSTENLSIAAADNGNYVVTASNGTVCPDKIDDLDVLHYSDLSIDSWYIPAQVCIGQTEVLSVVIVDKDDLLPAETYQWYKDGVPISTSLTYRLEATDKSQSGLYKVEVSDGCSTKTVSGYVSVYETIVATNTWESDTTICLGSELRLETNVTGDVTSYVWTKDDIEFAANSTYLKSAVDASDSGVYVCTVSGNCGDPIVYAINVSVIGIPEITTGIDVLPAVCEGDPLVLGPIAVTGTIDNLIWTLNDNSTNAISAETLNLGIAEISEAGNYNVSVSNLCGTDISYGNQIVNPEPAIAPIAPQTVCQGNDVVFRADATGAAIVYAWTIDGNSVGGNSSELIIDSELALPLSVNEERVYNVVCNITTACGDISETTTLTVKPRTILNTTLKNRTKYVGERDTLRFDISGVDLVFEWTHEAIDGTRTPLGITGNELVLTDIQMADAGYYTCSIAGACGQRLASGKLTVKEPVRIVTRLNDFEEKCEGDPLNLAIVATGQIDSVKWYKNNVLIPTETGLNLFISNLSIADAGVYKCEIFGEGISGITETSTVRVYSQTVLNASLSDVTLCENAMLDWIPDVSGTSAQTYIWYLNGTETSRGRLLHYDALALAHEGDYQVQVTSLCGDVTSSARLEVTELPVFVSATTDQTVCENTALLEFIVEYTGENLRYQWRKNGVDLAGETTQTLNLTFIQLDDAGDYNCRVYSTCGEEISPVASLSVTPQLEILSEQADIEVCNGEDVVLVADVEGINVTYQWKLNGVDLDIAIHPEANSATLHLRATTSDDNGYYTCIVSDDCTSSRSTKPTELLVNRLPDTEIFGRMILCAKEDRVTYVTIDQPDINYGWDVTGGDFSGPEVGSRTRITWGELADGSLSIAVTDRMTGCRSRVDSAVILRALPEVNLEDSRSRGVCEGEFELTGGFPEGGIYWVNGISQTTFNPSDRGAGTYAVNYSYTDDNGCSNVTSIDNLQIDILPVVDVIDDITVGSCVSTALTANTEEDNIQWFKIQDTNRVLPIDLDNANSMTPTFTPGESQVLLATVQDEHGCEGIDILNLNVAPLPVVTTITDRTVGQCNQLVLLTDIVGDKDIVSWTNPDHLDDANSVSPKIINAPAGTHTYTINVTDLYGCDATGEVNVTMVADPSLGEDKFGCEGDSFEVNLADLENPFWSNSDWDNEERERINVLDTYTVKIPGQYLLEVSNKYNCGDEQAFVINPHPDLGLKDNLSFDGKLLEQAKDGSFTIFEGQELTLGPNLPSEFAPYFFEWQDGSILQRFDVSEEGKYILKVEDNLGCVSVDSVHIKVKPVGIEAPNAFIPKLDGSDDENAKFYLKDINYDIQEFEMYVYDRWGELLFKTKEVGRNGGWDGKYKGKLCPAGAYVWVAFINGEFTNKGTFVLVR